MVNPNLKGNGWHEFHGYFSSQSNTEERESVIGLVLGV